MSLLMNIHRLKTCIWSNNGIGCNARCPFIAMKYGILDKIMILIVFSGLSGCKADEPETYANTPLIEITAGVENNDRGVTTTYNIPDFRVSAFRNGIWGQELLMDNVVVTRTGINSWIYYPAVEWPDNESVDFFAVSPASMTIQNNQWWFHTFRYDNVNCDTDLLVSVASGVNQSSERLRLNFRHALARVRIMLKCSDSTQKVGVSEVQICNISRFGTFFYPAKTTSADTNTGELFDCWHTYDSHDDITVFKPEVGNFIYLSEKPMDIGPENIFMIPDSLDAMKPDIIWEGCHIMVKYTHNGNEEVARIPIRESTPNNRWEPGKSYRYTIDVKPLDSTCCGVESAESVQL